MKNVKSKSRIVSFAAVLFACLMGAAGLMFSLFTDVSASDKDSFNGETPISITEKTSILQAIKDKDEKLSILEIVPFESASILQVMTNSETLQQKLAEHAEELYNAFLWTKKTVGQYSTVTVQGGIAYQHPFYVTYDSIAGTYTVEYPDFFIEGLIDKYAYPEFYEYFTNNTEVITVVASDLKESDFIGSDGAPIDMIYISDLPQNIETINLYNLLFNDDIVLSGSSVSVTGYTGAYTDATGSTSKNYSSAWYNSYVYNEYGQCVPNDMSWEMVEYALDFIYGTNETPVPVIMNLGNNFGQGTYNIDKFCNVICKTSDEADATISYNYGNYKTVVSSYYWDVAENYLAARSGDANAVNVTESSATYVDKVVYFDSPVSVSYSGGTVTVTGKNVTKSVKTSDGADVVGGFMKIKTENGAQYLCIYDEEGILVNKISTSFSAMTMKVKYNSADCHVEEDNFYYSSTTGLTTGAYIYAPVDVYSNGSEVAQSVVIYDDKWTGGILFFGYLYQSKHVFNYAIQTNNNGIDTMFSIDKNFVTGIYDESGVERDAIDEDGNLTVSSSLNYLLGLDTLNSKVKVLEIQPYNDFTYDTLDNLKLLGSYLRVRGYSQWYDISDAYAMMDVTYVTTAGFNSMKEDLISSYDLIIFGDNIGNYDDSFAEHYQSYWPITVDGYFVKHNDSSLNFNLNGSTVSGYVITAYGDIFGVNNLATLQSGTTRFAGNDITQKRKEELIAYINAGMPVVLSDNLYTTKSSAYPSVQDGSATHEVIDVAVGKGNVIPTSLASMRLFPLINNNSLSVSDIKVTTQTGQAVNELTYTTGSVGSADYNVTDKNSVVENVSGLKLSITFETRKNNSYRYKVIIDKDLDGTFDENDEVYYVSDVFTADKNSTVKECSITIPELYEGMLSYRILVEQIKNGVATDRDTYDAKIAIHNEIKQIKVLQVIDDTSDRLDISDMTGNFVKYLDEAKQITGCHIVVQSITPDKFAQYFAANGSYDGTNYEEGYLAVNNYSMLVLSDNTLRNTYGELDYIAEFANRGHTVVLTAGCMDSVYYAEKFRDYAGMNRYYTVGASVTEADGYTDAVIYQNGNGSNTYGGKLNWSSYSTFEANKVAEVNEGQVTSYPFDISDGELTSISGTPAQKYQLDMEGDISVWYTLEGNASGTKDSYFDDNPLDGRNNYYLYTYGNFIYCGMGSKASASDAELRLFVNTLIYGASVTNHSPEVNVLNAAESKTTGKYVLYLNALDTEIELTTMVNDIDLMQGMAMDGELGWFDSYGNKHVTETYNAGSNPLYNKETMSLVFGQDTLVYKEYAKYGKVTMYIMAYDEFGESGYTEVIVANHQLFDLD